VAAGDLAEMGDQCADRSGRSVEVVVGDLEVTVDDLVDEAVGADAGPGVLEQLEVGRLELRAQLGELGFRELEARALALDAGDDRRRAVALDRQPLGAGGDPAGARGSSRRTRPTPGSNPPSPATL